MAEPKKTYTDKNETGCCPIPDVNEWDESKVVWKEKKFIRESTRSFFYIPLNMGPMMNKAWKKITDAKADPATSEWMMLSRDLSPWKAEHFLATKKEVSGAENTTLSGTFLTKVFEGPYKDAPKWVKEMESYVKEKDEKMQQLYFWYTTCPKCYKHYKKNYVVALAQVE